MHMVRYRHELVGMQYDVLADLNGLETFVDHDATCLMPPDRPVPR